MCKLRKLSDAAGRMKDNKSELCAMPTEFANYLQTYSYDDEEEQPFLHLGCQCPRLVKSTSAPSMSCPCHPPSASSPCGQGPGILKTKHDSTSSTSFTDTFYLCPDDDSGYGGSQVFYSGESDGSFTSSLCSTPCSSPKKGNSRRVSFADECGKDLVLVQVFSSDDLPVLSPMGSPMTVRRNARSLMDMPVRCKSSPSAPTSVPPKPRLAFEQPAADFADFIRRIRENKVSLENIIVTEKSLFGTIKVENMCYTKEVFVRCSFDRWVSHFDIPAVFVPCCDSDTTINAYDTFSFETTLSRGQGVYDSIEFAVCLKAQGQEYWDNFDKQNYRILCNVWHDSDDSYGDTDSSDEEDIFGSHGNKLLSLPPRRNYGDLRELNSITGVGRPSNASALNRKRRNFCLY